MKIEVYMEPDYECRPTLYFWMITEWTGRVWYDVVSDWASSPEEAWKAAMETYKEMFE